MAIEITTKEEMYIAIKSINSDALQFLFFIKNVKDIIIDINNTLDNEIIFVNNVENKKLIKIISNKDIKVIIISFAIYKIETKK